MAQFKVVGINQAVIKHLTNYQGETFFGDEKTICYHKPEDKEISGICRTSMLRLLKDGQMSMIDLHIKMLCCPKLKVLSDYAFREYFRVKMWSCIDAGLMEITIDHELALPDPERWSKYHQKKVANA